MLVCVNQPCTEHKHVHHPGVGHCSSCIDEKNEGYDPYSEHTFRDDEYDRRHCCCRDARIASDYQRAIRIAREATY